MTASGVDDQARLDGFTIRDGFGNGPGYYSGDAGGALYNEGGHATIARCLFTGNRAEYGGAVFNINGAAPAFVDCHFEDNITSDHIALYGWYGGAMCNYDSTTFIDMCIFANNASWSDGGALYNEGGIVVIVDSEFTGNSTHHARGGAVANIAATFTIERCGFSNNRGHDEYVVGGAVYSEDTQVSITDTYFVGNHVGYHGGAVCGIGGTYSAAACVFAGNDGYAGGAMYLGSTPSVSITNCAAYNNRASEWGGALALSGCSAIIENCTIVGNDVSESLNTPAGGIQGGYALVLNSIVWGNTSNGAFGEGAQLFGPTADYSCIEGWTGALGGDGNIGADPLFADADGPDGDPNTWQDNDFQLSIGSPCVDTGDPSYVPVPDETDLAGTARIWDGDGDGTSAVDMGAYEFGSFRFGDLNCDGWVNNGDIDAFVYALSYPEQYPNEYPDCDIMLGDINGDGDINNGDIDWFVALLSE